MCLKRLMPHSVKAGLIGRDAVDLGADYYDGDNDGTYNPTDKNGNGLWDADEDRPDLIGDETVWCVYWDGLPYFPAKMEYDLPLGIESSANSIRICFRWCHR
ncbi:MAG: hypothetical protein MZV64_38640 [Ignavibacteriales bacterium]|nr:hypothetical protein [Ignavibacteriales bacterium]